jgi:putative flippase GtrA
LPWRQPARFALVGVANTLLGLAVIYAGKLVLGLSDVPANALGYAAGLALSFFANAAWTFDFRGPLAPRALRYICAFAVAYGANLAALMVLTAAGVDGYLAQAASVVPYAVTFYLVSKRFVFGR